MERVFLHIFRMSITASLLVLAVMILRLLLKKAPKALVCILWGFVAVRLILPISLESPFSLIPSHLTGKEPVSSEAYTSDRDFIPLPVVYADTVPPEDTPTEPVTDSVPYISSAVSSPGTAFLSTALSLASFLWPVGIFGMLLYGTICYLRIRKKVKEAIIFRDNIWLCDHVETPFILGIFRPRILLPSTIQPPELTHVIAHENAHLKRLDHFWKPLGYLLLSVYWFNPVLWLAYLFLCRDIELACDERVIRNMDTDNIKAYSSTLLSYSVSRKLISICPLAFGEVHVKKRIKNALHYKKPTFWILLVTVVSCIAVAICFLTNPVSPEKDDTAERASIADSAKDIALLSYKVTDTGSDFTGILISPETSGFYTSAKLENMTLPVQWSNRNLNFDLEYGPAFDILFLENNVWNSCFTGTRTFPEMNGFLPRKTETTRSYTLTDFDLSESGLYRFQAEPQPGKYIWFDFELVVVPKNAPEGLSDSALLSIADAISTDRTNCKHIIADYPELYELLLSGGTSTVKCFVRELNLTENYGIREYLMAQICSELTGIGKEDGEYDPELWWATADQWLNIYNKQLAASELTARAEALEFDPVGTSAEWKNTVLHSDMANPKTPTPRSLVWLNYCYNREKNPEGILKLELPEFPGVTFYATSNEIFAYTSTGRRSLISGSCLWSAYVADLNSDGFPEFCATVSLPENPAYLGLEIYDYTNRKHYGIQDTEQYDYMLFGTDTSMFVRKLDRNKTEPDAVYEAALISISETGSVALELTEAPAVRYKTVYRNDHLIDLLGYSNLYSDLTERSSRWSSEELYPIYDIRTQDDWNAFISSYSKVSVWKEQQILSLSEAFTDEFLYCLEYSIQDDFHPVIILSPNGIVQGWASYPIYRPLLTPSPTQG